MSNTSLFDILTSKNNTPSDGNITIVSIDNIGNKNSEPEQMDFTGYFIDTNNKAVSVNKFTIGGYDIPAQANNRYSLGMGNTTQPAAEAVANTICGKTVDYVVESSVFGNLNTRLHMPALLEMSVESAVKKVIKLSEPLKINWKPDEFNSDRVEDDELYLTP